MFPHLSRLAKASLTIISHGNAVAERGFSVNTAVLSKDRMSLDETTIQAVRLVKETIRLRGKPTAVPMTPIGGGSYWAGRAAARPLLGPCGPPLYLARPLFRL